MVSIGPPLSLRETVNKIVCKNHQTISGPTLVLVKTWLLVKTQLVAVMFTCYQTKTRTQVKISTQPQEDTCHTHDSQSL